MNTLQSQIACGEIEPQFLKQEICHCNTITKTSEANFYKLKKTPKTTPNTQILKAQKNIKNLMQLIQQHTCCQ